MLFKNSHDYYLLHKGVSLSRKKLRYEEIYPGLGNRLRKIRGEATQSVFARKLGVTDATISRYESGEINPPEPVLRKYAELGRTTIKALLRGEETCQIQTIPQFRYFIPSKESESEYSTLSAINIELLTRIIATLEREILKRKISLSPLRKGHVISLIYDYCFSKNKEVTPDIIDCYLHLVK